MAGVAVKVTLVPVQIEVEFAIILSVGTTKGVTVIAIICGAELPQLFIAVTVIFPELFPGVTLSDIVPWPALIDQPVGTVHVYPVAPITSVIL